MKLESVSVRVLTSDLHQELRRHEAAMARAVGADISRGEKSLVVLRFAVTVIGDRDRGSPVYTVTAG